MLPRLLHLCLALALFLVSAAGCNSTAGQSRDAGSSNGAGNSSPRQSTVSAATPSITPSTPSPSIVGKDGAEMLLVPAGKFIMGASDQHFDQRPVHEVTTGAYYMDKLEVTNAEYKKFVDATGHQVPYLDADYAQKYNWQNGTYPPGKDDYPVVLVDWHDAQEYCQWAGKRLPSEPEWEKAARGKDGRIFPWGNEFDVARMNSWEAGPGETTPVGRYAQGASPYGILDMAGNVWEWTADWFDRYPGNDDVSDHYGTTYKVLRGTSWGNVIKYARGSNRHWVEPWTKNTLTGLRCVVSNPGR
ncbi:MAG: formylglycine-generating enzyme family protein [Chloroflexi bacterium]|nr:formylglycine-generating enzyme family protein [Chloroflexota bacterium]